MSITHEIEIKEIKHNSNEYWELVNIRELILRKPLGLSFSKKELLNEHHQIHVALYHNNKMAGGLILATNESLIKMRQVCISSHFQGNGYGKHLTKFAIYFAKEHGYTQVYCHARKSAIEFYTSLGFTTDGEEFLEVGIPHVKMRYTIHPSY